MPSREPAWWHVPERRWQALALSPIAAIWSLVAQRRMMRSSAHRADLPVVCIGNFTAGGTGKTPLTQLIADALRQRGYKPVVLTRGYGSKTRIPRIVDPGRHSTDEVGDEALLLAAAVPVMVAPDRAAGARAITETGIDADVIIMDDGLQNPSLVKDFKLAVVDGRRQFGNGCVIPSGPMRAPLDFQLPRVDAIVVNGTVDERDAVRRRIAGAFQGPVLLASVQPKSDTAWLSGTRVLAYSGIGHPERFTRLLSSLGAEIVVERMFPDHHPYSQADAEALLSDAAERNCELVSTEKDVVRLAGRGGALARLQRATRSVPINLQFEGGDQKMLIDQIEAAIARQNLQRAR